MGKIALITGPTSGIGRSTALELANKGYDMILVARDETKAKALIGEIGSKVRAEFILCDISSIRSVEKAVAEIREKYDRIDVLINNAGLIVQHRENSVDGIELTFATNYIGAFVLTTGLIDLLAKSTDPRVLNLASEAHFFAFFFDIKTLVDPRRYHDLIIYGRSKLANILFSNELAERLKPRGITSNAIHPGTVASNFGGNGNGATAWFMKLLKPLLKNTTSGASTTIYLATSPEVKGVTGQYFSNSKPARRSGKAKDAKLGRELWGFTEELVAVGHRRSAFGS